MKKVFLCLLTIILSLTSYSQIKDDCKIKSVMGIKFGSSLKAVTDTITKKGGSIAIDISGNTGTHVFKNIKFGGYDSYISFSFHEDKMYQAFVLIKVENDVKILDEYESIKANITSIYGIRYGSIRKYSYPYTEDGEDKWMAIKGGYAEISDLWKEPVCGKLIDLHISDKGGHIVIRYEDRDMSDRVKQSTNSVSDYQ